MKRVPMSATERNAFEIAVRFLEGGLTKPEVLLWASKLSDAQVAERQAIDTLLFRIKNLREPYVTAWDAVFEYWARPDGHSEHERHLLKTANPESRRTSDEVRIIVEAVRPFLKVEDPKKYAAFYTSEKPPRRRGIRALLRLSISSGDILLPEQIGLQKIVDEVFLTELVKALDTALFGGLALMSRFPSTSGMAFSNYLVRRVYFVERVLETGEDEDDKDPDRFTNGLAPSSKLLHATLVRLAELKPELAKALAWSWQYHEISLYRRLWSAVARSDAIASNDEVFAFLNGLADKEFWDTHHHPEMAELRAVRWHGLQGAQQELLEKRLRKGPPVSEIPKRLTKPERKAYGLRRSLAELQRVIAAGGALSPATLAWMAQARENLENPPNVESVTQGFLSGPVAYSRQGSTGAGFDIVAPEKLSETLLVALNSDDPFDERAYEAARYIVGHPDLVEPLLVKAAERPEWPKALWSALGHYFRPDDLNATLESLDEDSKASLLPAAENLVSMISRLDNDFAQEVIGPLTSFMDHWDRLLGQTESFREAIEKLWPLASTAVNAEGTQEPTQPLQERAHVSPIGNLVSALFQALPRKANPPIFAVAPWKGVLEMLGRTEGEARLQMQYRLLEFVGRFYHAAPDWAKHNLILPLRDAKGDAVELWGGFSSTRNPQAQVFDILRPAMVEAAGNVAIPERTREELAALAVWSNLNSKVPKFSVAAFGNEATQQLLRVGSDAVRQSAARSLRDFLEYRAGNNVTPEAAFFIFRDAFSAIWPKEKTLNSSQVSDVFASIPAAAVGHFAEAADIVLPHLVPFDCWSLHDYGVYDRPSGDKSITNVESAADAKAFMAILDATIGEQDGAVIPRGLDKALTHILSKDKALERDRKFQRLLTLSRR